MSMYIQGMGKERQGPRQPTYVLVFGEGRVIGNQIIDKFRKLAVDFAGRDGFYLK